MFWNPRIPQHLCDWWGDSRERIGPQCGQSGSCHRVLLQEAWPRAVRPRLFWAGRAEPSGGQAEVNRRQRRQVSEWCSALPVAPRESPQGCEMGLRPSAWQVPLFPLFLIRLGFLCSWDEWLCSLHHPHSLILVLTLDPFGQKYTWLWPNFTARQQSTQQVPLPAL